VRDEQTTESGGSSDSPRRMGSPTCRMSPAQLQDHDAGPRHPHEQDKAHDVALPARDVRRDRIGARSRRRALPMTEFVDLPEPPRVYRRLGDVSPSGIAGPSSLQ